VHCGVPVRGPNRWRFALAAPFPTPPNSSCIITEHSIYVGGSDLEAGILRQLRALSHCYTSGGEEITDYWCELQYDPFDSPGSLIVVSLEITEAEFGVCGEQLQNIAEESGLTCTSP